MIEPLKLELDDGRPPPPPEEDAPARERLDRKARWREYITRYYAERSNRTFRRRKAQFLVAWLPAIARGELEPFMLKGIDRVPGMTLIGKAIAGFVALAAYLRGAELVHSHLQMACAVTLWLVRGCSEVAQEVAALLHAVDERAGDDGKPEKASRRTHRLRLALADLRRAARAYGLPSCSEAAARDWWYKFRDGCQGWVAGGVPYFAERTNAIGRSQLCNLYHLGLDAWGEVNAVHKRTKGRQLVVRSADRGNDPCDAGNTRGRSPTSNEQDKSAARARSVAPPGVVSPAATTSARPPGGLMGASSPAPAVSPSPTPTPPPATQQRQAASEGAAAAGAGGEAGTPAEAAPAARQHVEAPRRPIDRPDGGRPFLDDPAQPVGFRSPTVDRLQATAAAVAAIERGGENPGSIVLALLAQLDTPKPVSPRRRRR